MRNGSCVFDLLYGDACCLQGGDCRLAARTRTFDPDLDLLDPKLGRLFGSLLGSHLTGKRRALSRAFKVTSAGTGPAKGISSSVRDCHVRIVKSRLNESDCAGDISPRFASFVRCVFVDLLLCHN